MFEPVKEESSELITIHFEGTRFTVPAGITVAAAVMAYGRQDSIRISPADGEKRAPFCFIGVCHECLMEINSVPNQQACITEVQADMKIRRQNGPLEVVT